MCGEAPVPTFLVIGAARSGTTALTYHLSRHPDVYVAEPKENHFLALAPGPAEFRGPGDDEMMNRRVVTDPGTWYRLFREGADRLARGEGSVSTLYYADAAVANITRYCPDAVMIAILRDPVARAWSAHQYLTGRGFETEPFSEALDRECQRIEQGWHHLWHYTAMGRYTRQLAAFLEAFGPERLLVLDYEELTSDPDAVLGRCFSFVGVSPRPMRRSREAINVSGQARWPVVTALTRRPVLRTAARRVVPFGAREWLRRANARSAAMPQETRARLEEEFASERAELAALLGTGAPVWAASR